MQTLKDLLPKSISDTQVGEILSKIAIDTYSVKIGTRSFTLRNASGRDLNIGARVIVSKTKEGMYIVGESNYRGSTIKEFTING